MPEASVKHTAFIFLHFSSVLCPNLCVVEQFSRSHLKKIQGQICVFSTINLSYNWRGSGVLCVYRRHQLSVVAIYRTQAETVATDLKEASETNEDANGLGVIIFTSCCVRPFSNRTALGVNTAGLDLMW